MDSLGLLYVNLIRILGGYLEEYNISQIQVIYMYSTPKKNPCVLNRKVSLKKPSTKLIT